MGQEYFVKFRQVRSLKHNLLHSMFLRVILVHYVYLCTSHFIYFFFFKVIKELCCLISFEMVIELKQVRS